MALTFSSLNFSVAGNKRRTIGTVTFDTSYPTGGEAVTANQVGMGKIEQFLIAFPVSSTPAIRAADYDYTNDKLRVYGENFAEIANATDLSTFSCKFEAVGY